MAFSRRPPNDDDDDNERPDPPRWSSRPPGDEPGRPASRFGSDRPGTRDSESGDDFGFVRDRLGPSRRPGTPPDEPKDEGGGLVGGLFRRSKKEDDKDAPPPRSGSKPVTGSRPAPSAGRPVPPTAGRSSTPAGGARGDSADDEKKGRFGFLGRGSKDADKDEPPGRSSSTRRSPFLSSAKDDDPPPRSGSSLRDSQRAAGKTGPLPSRPGLGGDDENRSGPAFRPGGSSTPNRFGGAGGAGSPTDRPGSYGSRPGVPDRDADKDQPGGGRPAFGAGRSPFGTRPGSADDDDKDPPGGGRPAFGAGRSPFGTRPGSTDDDDKDPPGGGRPPFGTRPGADRSNQPGTGDRPGTGPARFGGAGGTGGSTDRPGGFGTRPGADRDQPGTGDRPGAGPARFGGAGGTGGSTDRPGSFGTRPGADRDQPGSGTSRFGGAGGTGGPADRPGSFGTRPGADRDQPGAGDRSGSGTSRFGGAGGIGGTGSSNSAADRTGSFGSRPGALGDRGDTGAGLGQRSSSSQTRGFPSRPLGREEEKKDEPRKSRLGGLLGRGKEEKKDDKKQDKRASAKTSSTPTAQPRFGGGTASSTLDKRRSTTTDTFGTATDARGRGQTAAPGRGADKTATGTTRRAVPASSVSREKAKPLPGQQRSALTVHQGLDFERRIDLIGVTLLGFALVSFFAVIPSITLGLLPEPHSGAIGAINHLLSQMFGWGKVVWPLIAGGLGIWLMRESFAERGFELDFFRIVGMILLYTCLLTWIQMFELVNDSAPTVEQFKPISYDLAVGQGQGGGWLGHTIYVFLLGQLLDWGTLSVLLAWLVMSLMLTFDLSLVELGGYVAAALAVFTISEEQRTRKRVAREALADEFKATMRPPEKEGAQTVLPGITTTVETPAVGKRGGAAARAAAPTTATAPDLPAVGRRGPAAPAGDPLAPAAPVPASPEPVRPALGESPQMPPVRSGPVINRRTGGFNGESTDEVLPGRDRAAEGTGPLSPMAGEAKTGEAGAATLSPRRMPHFRAGATDETNAVTPDQAESASGVDASKADDDASKRRFGFLGRGRDRAADQETPAADQPAAESSGVRRSPFARPGADPSAGESAPGIPVPGRPASASAPGESKPASEESGSRFGLLRRGGSSADSPAETSAADSTTPKEESRGGFGLGRFRRGGGASEEKEPLADSAAAPVSPESDKPAGEPGARRSPFSPTRSMSDPSRTSPLDEPKTDDSAPAGEPGLRRSPFSSTRS
ncbi:MAG: hypothetical protein HY866_21795, partial [Chloroflexi bacterium]|nr:hypothetical protein [Chloroflexota bacterium]